MLLSGVADQDREKNPHPDGPPLITAPYPVTEKGLNLGAVMSISHDEETKPLGTVSEPCLTLVHFIPLRVLIHRGSSDICGF